MNRPTHACRTGAEVSLDDRGLRRGAGFMRACLHDALAEAPTVLVDVSGIHRIDSEVVSTLLWARRQATGRGGRLVLRAPTRRSAAMVARSELAGLFEVDTARTPTSPWRHP